MVLLVLQLQYPKPAAADSTNYPNVATMIMYMLKTMFHVRNNTLLVSYESKINRTILSFFSFIQPGNWGKTVIHSTAIIPPTIKQKKLERENDPNAKSYQS